MKHIATIQREFLKIASGPTYYKDALPDEDNIVHFYSFSDDNNNPGIFDVTIEEDGMVHYSKSDMSYLDFNQLVARNDIVPSSAMEVFDYYTILL